jgi:TPR repeat protein
MKTFILLLAALLTVNLDLPSRAEEDSTPTPSSTDGQTPDHAKAEDTIQNALAHARSAKKRREALGWYLVAAQEGSPEGQYGVGALYLDSYIRKYEKDHQDKPAAKECDALARWFEKAANQGHVEAMNSLALLYDCPFCRADFDKALAWAKRSAETGDPQGEFDYGYKLEEGLGTVVDMPAAIAWYRKSAGQGNKDAEAALTRLNVTPEER